MINRKCTECFAMVNAGEIILEKGLVSLSDYLNIFSECELLQSVDSYIYLLQLIQLENQAVVWLTFTYWSTQGLNWLIL